MTKRGADLLETSPTRIDMTTLESFPEYRAWRVKSAGGENADAPRKR